MGKYPFFHQLDAMDCGPACLQMITVYYGCHFDLPYLRELCYANRNGVTLLGISNAAETIGFRCRAITTSFERFQQHMILPCIVFWRQKHFVVVYKVSVKKMRTGKCKGHVVVGDPVYGIITYPLDEFLNGWESDLSGGGRKGIVLMLSPSKVLYQNDTSEASKYNLFHFWKYIKPYSKLLLQVILGMTLGLVVQMIFPFMTQALVDVGVGNNNLNFIILILVGQLILSLSLVLVEFIQNWILLHVITRVNIALVSDFITKLLKLPIRFFDSKNTGDIMQRIDDHSRIQNFFTVTSIGTFFSFFSFLVFALILGYYNWYMLLFFLFGHVIYVGWVMLFLRVRRELDFKCFDQSARNQSNIIQLIEGAEEIKLNGCEQKMRWKWENIQGELFAISIKGMSVEQIQNLGAFFITNVVNTILLASAAWLVVEGNITLGMMMALSYILGQLKGPIQNFIDFIHAYQDAKISLERLGEIHLKKDEDEMNRGRQTELSKSDRNIYMENVGFSYWGPSTALVLEQLDLCIGCNQVTAIVGESGSGKTTLLKLLLGYYQPQQGRIKVGDVDLQDIHTGIWRGRCAAVMQDGYVFSETIAENIGVKDEEVDKERLLYAAKLASIEDFITNLPSGYQTKIGQEGCGLSQGQKQRILIARAIYRDPEYLFFDEATNALDANNEKSVMSNMESFFRGRTVVIVAHRLSTVKNADKIIVLQYGKIVEAGKHNELVARRGYYYNLVKNQLELGQ